MKTKPDTKIESEYHVLKFGKYKGHTIKYVLIHDPSYIIWLRHKDIYVNPRIYTKAQALYEKEMELRTKAYEHLNHNYSSYYEDDGDWFDQYGSSIWD